VLPIWTALKSRVQGGGAETKGVQREQKGGGERGGKKVNTRTHKLKNEKGKGEKVEGSDLTCFLMGQKKMQGV